MSSIVGTGISFISPKPVPVNVIRKVSYEEMYRLQDYGHGLRNKLDTGPQGGYPLNE